MAVPKGKRKPLPSNLETADYANNFLTIINHLINSKVLNKPLKTPTTPEEANRLHRIELEREKVYENYKSIKYLTLECYSNIMYANAIQDCNANNSKRRYTLQETAYREAITIKALLNHSSNCYHLSKKKYKALNDAVEPLIHSLKGWMDWELTKCKSFYDEGKFSKSLSFLKEID